MHPETILSVFKEELFSRHTQGLFDVDKSVFSEISALVRSRGGGGKGREVVSLRRVSSAGEMLTRVVERATGWLVCFLTVTWSPRMRHRQNMRETHL